MKRSILLIFPVLIAFGFTYCKVNYKLSKPTKTIELDSELDEISGLTCLSDSVIAAVQDEEGKVYLLDAQNGSIIDDFKFGKNGDYEGITHIKKTFYVLRSDGTIFKFKKGKDPKKYSFKNNKGFDFEGLCVDEKNGRLLVACKTHGDKDKKDNVYIYDFSLEDKKYRKEPAYKFKKKDIHSAFKPSGIAIHPDGSIYILSSYSKTLVVVDNTGAILENVQLDPAIFYQAEGITFNSKGEMYISNEKNEYTPTLLFFKKGLFRK